MKLPPVPDTKKIVPAGTLHSLDEPLPIQLASLTATITAQNQVHVDWVTLSETNNYGFEVQKSIVTLSS